MRNRYTLFLLCCVFFLVSIVPLPVTAAQNCRFIQTCEMDGENIYIRCANMEQESEYTVALWRSKISQ